MIADTMFLIDLMRSDKSAVDTETMLEKNGIPVYLTSVSFFNFMRDSTSAAEEYIKARKIDRVLGNLQILQLDF